jgi:hypothetical protein
VTAQQNIDVRDAIDRMVRRLVETRDVNETLTALTAAAVDSIPPVHFASVSYRTVGKPIETLAPTDPLAVAIDELQYDLSEGPCYAVVAAERVALSNDLSKEERWPEFGPRAAALGVGSQLALVLVAEARQRAALNLYSRDRQAFDGSFEIAELFATQAALVLGFSRTIQNLDDALGSRTVIGQAVGIVMERYGVDQTRAFEYLTRLSQNSNTKLRTVADRLVNEGSPDEPRSRT